MPIEQRGSYCIEGALTIFIFTACMMALLSLLLIVKVEGEVQDALNAAAIRLSSISYEIGSAESAALPGQLRTIFVQSGGQGTGVPTAALAKEETFRQLQLSGLSKWLRIQGVRGGMGGLSFAGSRMYGQGKTISLQVSYRIRVNTYGLFRKELPICQIAETEALLPENASALLKGSAFGDGGDSIWKKPPFVRGRFFMKTLRGSQFFQSALPDTGIDFYNPATGQIMEQYSINLFDPYYSMQPEAAEDPGAYTVSWPALEREVLSYGRDLNRHIRRLKGRVKMKNGTVYPLKPGRKQILLTVPEEAEQNPSMQHALKRLQSEMKEQYGISVTVRYLEEALV